MDHGTARETKAQAVDYARELSERVIRPSDVADGGPALAIGLAPQPDGTYALAVRYRLGLPSVRSIARKVAAEVGTDVDVRRTGRISTLADDPAEGPSAAAGDHRPRPRARPGRTRPLRPGISIAHVKVTAGTLGAFVPQGRGGPRAVQLPRAGGVAAGARSATRSCSRVPPTVGVPRGTRSARWPPGWTSTRPRRPRSTARSRCWTTRRSTRSTRSAGSPRRPSRSAASRWPRSVAPRR